MKFLSLLLLVSLLTVSSAPCCDEADDCCGAQTTQTDHSHENNLPCSPFFIACNLCPGFLVKETGLEINPIYNLLIKPKSLHSNIKLRNYYAEFWQPPKIG